MDYSIGDTIYLYCVNHQDTYKDQVTAIYENSIVSNNMVFRYMDTQDAIIDKFKVNTLDIAGLTFYISSNFEEFKAFTSERISIHYQNKIQQYQKQSIDSIAEIDELIKEPTCS